MKTKKIKEAKSKKKLHEEAWKLQSLYLRKTAANFQGYAPCYSCGLLFDWKTMTLGHFRHDCYDFDSLNVHPQCRQCNYHKRGNLVNYTIHLVKDYGINRVEVFQKIKKWNDYNVKQLEEIIMSLAVLLNDLT